MNKLNKRNRAPVLSELTDYGVVFKKTVLPNGVRILSEEVPGVASYSLGICIDSGSRNDPDEYKGLAHFAEHALFLGTEKRSAAKISAEFESEGAYSNAFTTKELTCYYIRALKSHFGKTMEILSDLVLNPVFNAKKVEKEKAVIIEEIKSYEDEPEEYIFDKADSAIFGEHSLAHPIAGYIETVSKIDSGVLHNYHNNYYTPENILISAAGNITHSELLCMAEDYFGGMALGKYKNELSAPPLNKPKTVSMRRQYQQAHITLARMSPGITSQDRYSLAILNIVLGDGLSSRLHRSLREKAGIAYNVYSSVQMLVDTGMFYVYAGADKSNISRAEKLIFSEFDKLINDRISSSEIKRAKEQIKSNTIMALESMNTRMTTMVKSELTLGRYEDIPSTIQAIDNIGMDDIKSAAINYLQKSDWNIITIIPK